MEDYLPSAVLLRPKTALVRDPLEVCWETGRWSPDIPDDDLPNGAEHFVDLKKWRATLKYFKGYTCGPNLFSLAFFRWLKDIENREGIK